MKIYAVALLAFSDIQDASNQNQSDQDSEIAVDVPLGTYTECLPALIPADSMQEAFEQARVFALDKWKTDEGWHTHQANIMPVPEKIYDAIFAALDANTLEVGDDEPGQTFNF